MFARGISQNLNHTQYSRLNALSSYKHSVLADSTPSFARSYATKKKAQKKWRKTPRLSDPVTVPGLKKGKDFDFDVKDSTFRRLMHLGYLHKHSGKLIPQEHDTKKFQQLYDIYDKTQVADNLLNDAHENLPKFRIAAGLKKKDVKRMMNQERQRMGQNNTPLLATLNRDIESIEKRQKTAEQKVKDVELNLIEQSATEPHDLVDEEKLSRRAKKISPEWYALFSDPYRKEEQDALMPKFRDWITNHSFGMDESQKIFASWLVNVKGRSDVIAKVMKINLYNKHFRGRSEFWTEQLEEEWLSLPEDFEDEYSPVPPEIDQITAMQDPEVVEDQLNFWFTEDLSNYTEMAGKQYGYDAFSHHLAQFYESFRDTFREHKREKKYAMRRTGRVDPARVLYSRPETHQRTATKIRDGFGPLTPQMEKSMPNDVLVSMEKLEDSESIADNSMTGFGRDSHEVGFPTTPQYHKNFEEMPIFGDEDYFEDEEDTMHWDEGMHLYPFELYTVENRSVTNITAKGRVNSNTVLVIYGNYHGTCGWGYGKGTSEAMAMTNARSDAIRNFVNAPVYAAPYYTIPHPVKASFSSASVELYPSKRLSAEPFLARVCELFGLQGVRVRTAGRRNKRNLLRAFFKAVMSLRDDYDIAVGMGRQLPTDVKRFYYETANAQYKRGINMYN